MNNNNSPDNPLNFTLKDGRQLTIRPIQANDAPLLQDFFQRLSPESVYFRFLEYLKFLPGEQAEQLAGVDYHTRMAFVACVQVKNACEIIAVARYNSVDPALPGRAEVGVVVEDQYQQQGLGAFMMQILAEYALKHGVTVFTGAVSPANLRVLKFIEASRLPYQKRYVEGVWEVDIFLKPAE